MKKYIFILLVVIPFLTEAQVVNLYPDVTWRDESDHSWEAHGTAFYNYQGDLYCVRYKPQEKGNWPSKHTMGYPHFYTCIPNSGSSNSDQLIDYNFGTKHQNYIDNWGYMGEDGAKDEPKIIGQNFFFEYNQSLWYFQHLHSNLYPGTGNDLVNESNMCFARMPSNTSQDPDLYYVYYHTIPDIHPMGAVQLDTLLYFFSLNENSKSTDYHKWFLQEYYYNTSVKYFIHLRDIKISNIKGDKFGGFVSRTDSLGNPYLFMNTYDHSSHVGYVGKLSVTKASQMQFSYEEYTNLQMTGTGATTIVPGSIKGQRSSDPNPGNKDRVAMYGINSSKASDGQYHVSYKEFYVNKNKLFLSSGGEVIMPSNFFPHQDSDEFNIVGVFETVLKDCSQEILGKDGFQEYSWFFFPDNDGQIAGACFSSDVWAVLPGSLVSSTDLSNDDESMYGRQIRTLWSLVGILDGAPPAVIDWDVWNSLHTFEYKPTEITFTQTTGTTVNTTVTNSFGAQFTRGSEISMGSKKAEFEFGNKRKWSGNLESKVNLGTSVKREQTIPFELDRETQEYGVFLWSIPQMDRFTYMVYPWWETQLKNPVPNSLQYLFRITGMSLYAESIELAEAPFSIPDPVENNLKYWKQESRQDLYKAVHQSNINGLNISWTDRTHGTETFLRTGKDSTSTFSWDIEYERETTAGFAIPKVFSVEAGVGTSIKYSTDTKVHTFFGTSLKASLSHLFLKSDGINMNYLSINVYTLKPEDKVPYWFYNDLDGQKPWYIAYIVTDCYDKIVSLAPMNDACLSESGMMFSWASEAGSLSDYTFFISSSPGTSPATILFQKSTGNQTTLSADGFTPEKGQAYYWCVRGVSPQGEQVWSDPKRFVYTCNETIAPQNEKMKAMVYPNPSSDRDFTIAVETKTEGTIMVTLTKVDGIVLGMKEVSNTAGSIVNVAFPELDLSTGIYFAVIRSGNEQVVRKVMIR